MNEILKSNYKNRKILYSFLLSAIILSEFNFFGYQSFSGVILFSIVTKLVVILCGLFYFLRYFLGHTKIDLFNPIQIILLLFSVYFFLD